MTVTEVVGLPGGASREQQLEHELDQLRRAMVTRAVIEQAKGILIARTGCDAVEAFGLLVLQSQHENRKLWQVAQELVALNVRQRPRAASCADSPVSNSGRP